MRRAAFEVTLRRPLLTAATKLFLPLFVILLVAVIALFIHPKELEVRAGRGRDRAARVLRLPVRGRRRDAERRLHHARRHPVPGGVRARARCSSAVSVAAHALHERDREARLEAARQLARSASCPWRSSSWRCCRDAARGAAANAMRSRRRTRCRGRNPSAMLLRIGIEHPAARRAARSSAAARSGPSIRTEPDGTKHPGARRGGARDHERLAALPRRRQPRGDAGSCAPDLKWSDGKPLTADDLKFALEVSPDPRIVEARVVDPRVLVVRFRDRVAAALEPITPLPRHALEEAYKKGGFEAVREFRLYERHAAARGPTASLDSRPNDHLVLETNPHFAGPAPSIPRIEIKRYKTDADARGRVREGRHRHDRARTRSRPRPQRELAKRRPEAVNDPPLRGAAVPAPRSRRTRCSRSARFARALLKAIDRERMRTRGLRRRRAPRRRSRTSPCRARCRPAPRASLYDAEAARSRAREPGRGGCAHAARSRGDAVRPRRDCSHRSRRGRGRRHARAARGGGRLEGVSASASTAGCS